MSRMQLRFHTFVVRCRLEESESTGATEWRGVVSHIPGGESMEHRDLSGLLVFIREILERALHEPDGGP